MILNNNYWSKDNIMIKIKIKRIKYTRKKKIVDDKMVTIKLKTKFKLRLQCVIFRYTIKLYNLGILYEGVYT